MPDHSFTDIHTLYELYRSHPKVVTDSRQVAPGCLFFALKGEKFDGNAFAAAALKAGAACAVIDDAQYKTSDRLLLVEDVLSTLQELSQHHRRQFDIPVIAITGSNGKTTTKELVNCVLSSHYPAHCTKGNLNNHIGVPLTLLAMPPKTEIAIIEMGANHPGEIDFLCRIAEPTHGLITNVGKAHLEGFGGFEGVKRTKSELYRFLEGRNGLLFINADEPYLPALAGTARKKLFYGRSQEPGTGVDAPFGVRLESEDPFVEVSFATEQGDNVLVRSHLTGRHNFQNIMTAIALGKYFKVPDEKIKVAIEGYVPSNNRSQWLTVGANTYLLDAYNANPTSMRYALEAFSRHRADKKLAILGAMLELGEYSEAEHLEIAHYAREQGFESLVLVGKEFESAAATTGALFFQNTEALKAWFHEQHFSGVHVLVKGSRSIGLERLLEKK